MKWLIRIMIVVSCLVLSYTVFALMANDCERRGGVFEYATAYKTYICIGAQR